MQIELMLSLIAFSDPKHSNHETTKRRYLIPDYYEDQTIISKNRDDDQTLAYMTVVQNRIVQAFDTHHVTTPTS